MLPALYATTLLVSAALLFCVQPMVARMVLPLAGGSAAVWTTCMVFFQAALLAGYGYSHGSLALLGPRKQSIVHLFVLLLPFLFLPLAIHTGDGAQWPPDANPAPRLLWLLVTRVGVPFFVISTSAPLLQRWFVATGHDRSKDPYWLYVASNAGSLLSLLAYPLLLEPRLGLRTQASLWRWGYGLLCVLVLVCAVTVRSSTKSEESTSTEPSISWNRRLRWIAQSAIPSSLLSAVTMYLTADISSMPLLWVIPLALYLLTFTLAFSSKPILTLHQSSRALPLPTVLAALLLLADASGPLPVLLLVNLSLVFLASMVCHGALAEDRPPAKQLTEFYLWVSLGGVLGGAFNALVAPVLFRGVWEYPLMLLAACLFRVRQADHDDSKEARRNDVLHVLAMGALTAIGAAIVGKVVKEPGRMTLAVVFAPTILLNYRQLLRPGRFVFGLAAIMAASTLYTGYLGKVLFEDRSFFGVVRVTMDPTGRFRQIVHGNTVHGRQSTVASERHTPLAYYHPTGPAGAILRHYQSHPGNGSIAAIGLGSGALAAYRRPQERWTFFELDPLVERVARDPQYFTYLSDAFPRSEGLTMLLGDARLRIREVAPGSVSLLLLDAFSSDSIPVHLVVREAMNLYLRALEQDGIMAFHVSNRYLELRPVVAALGREVGFRTYCWSDSEPTEAQLLEGKIPSVWCVLARRAERLGPLTQNPWEEIVPGPGRRAWTDDESNVLSTVIW